jgi:hypothetical protein
MPYRTAGAREAEPAIQGSAEASDASEVNADCMIFSSDAFGERRATKRDIVMGLVVGAVMGLSAVYLLHH